MRGKWTALLLCAHLLLPGHVTAREEPAQPASAVEEPAQPATVEEFLASLRFEKGSIALPGGVARLEMPDSFRYLPPADARRLLEDGWGNPPGAETLGMLVPTDADLFSDGGWAVVITFKDDGHVSDEDAEKIDYDELLASMRESLKEENAEREKLGYERLEIVGWAAPPRYDAAAKKLHWAKELRFGEEEENTLNYNVRILGRKGVLVMNAVSSMSQLSRVEQGMQQVLAFTEFQQGHRYSDFDPGIDKVAAYGVGALVAGKLAAKVGLLAKFGAILLALKKFALLAVVAVGAFLRKIFRGRAGEKTGPAQS